jgi:osmotically inducible protein OsmC
MKRKGSAVWQGSVMEGSGSVSTPSGVLSETQYSFSSRFEEGIGTNPEELIAAAHAGCFSMALSGQLSRAGFPPERIATTVTVTVEKLEGGFEFTAIHLDTTAKVPGLGAEQFAELAGNAKIGCPVSKLFNAPITMDAKLEE